MKKIIYVPVYLNGDEENLPKEDGYYFISMGDRYDINNDIFHFTKINAKQNHLDWLEHVVFWLKPVELPNERNIMKKIDFGYSYTAHAQKDGALNLIDWMFKR